MNDLDDVRILKDELLGLFDRIQRIRREIASIRKPGETHDRFATMSDELDAIVESTEGATNSIMENAEAIDEIVTALRPTLADDAAAARLDTIPDHIGAIFEACSFQDITGQRITKVVKTLQYIEKRVNALISVWGEAALSSVEPRDEDEALSVDDERRLLHGPQLRGQGVSQTDVDAILGETLPQHAEAPGASPADGQGEASPRSEGGSDPDTARDGAEPARSDAADGTPDEGGAGKEAAKPAGAPRREPAKPQTRPDDAGEVGPGLDQTDIDKLFG
ncbi:protein phosphatase CheZ [Roseospira goensis]|uniref:Chemotaxis protein CheZ n=1 Tax=Roseospira goensis TaxID=391922 RepID=A0A7W6RX48_9PROT|nr:protein phosphatase CheZ [Roseospira goensis]MBB4284840.1 hypothetical protein [Roseospira goensis]